MYCSRKTGFGIVVIKTCGLIKLAVLVCATAMVAHSATGGKQDPLVIRSQGSFFVGGASTQSSLLSGSDESWAPARHGVATTGQMYVQYQIPVDPVHLPVIMVHGGGLSGQAYETTPDGRMGWSEYFLRAGRPVYLVDQVGRGRSGFDGTVFNAVRRGVSPPETLPAIRMLSHELAWKWFRIGPEVDVPFPDSQFPVEAIGSFYKMWIPDFMATAPEPNPNYRPLADLSEQLGGAVVIGHSQSFMFPERAALINPTAVRGIISLESGYACDARFTAQERAILAKIPILIVFADHLADAPAPFASRWTTSLKQCRDFAKEIEEAGGDVTFLHLPEIGVRGNSHMFMLDRNNQLIADLLLAWIDDHVERCAKQPPGVCAPHTYADPADRDKNIRTGLSTQPSR